MCSFTDEPTPEPAVEPVEQAPVDKYDDPAEDAVSLKQRVAQLVVMDTAVGMFGADAVENLLVAREGYTLDERRGALIGFALATGMPFSNIAEAPLSVVQSLEVTTMLAVATDPEAAASVRELREVLS